MEFDYEKLRSDLIDFYGTASIYNPIAMYDIGLVERANGNELLRVAQNNGFNLNDYVKKDVYKKVK